MLKSPAIHQTPLYRAKAAYRNMARRCENKCGTEPAYANVKLKMTMAEWLAWAVPRYEEFLAENPGVRPSVSRKGDKGHYQIGNVEIISFGDNLAERPFEKTRAKDGRKTCSACQKNLPLDKFTKKKSAGDGYDYDCRECKSKRMKIRNLKPEIKAARRQKRRLDTDLHFD